MVDFRRLLHHFIAHRLSKLQPQESKSMLEVVTLFFDKDAKLTVFGAALALDHFDCTFSRSDGCCIVCHRLRHRISLHYI